MSVQLKVVRGAGNTLRPQAIVDPLLNRPAAQARGRVELDLGSGYIPASQTVAYTSGLRVGQLISSTNRLDGQHYRGVITSVEYGQENNGDGVFPVVVLGIAKP